MSGKCPQCGESLVDQTILTDGTVKCQKCGHDSAAREIIETLWAGAITTNARPEVTLKLDTPDSKDETSTISDRLSLREQSVAEPGARPEPPPHYELLQQLGEGGMGIVYRAKQTSADRTIALKLIKEQYQADRRHRNGFLSEAVATANLDHPNIVPVYDVGSREDGTVFYAMKEVHGTEWKSVIKGKSQAENLDLFMRVADAVAFAHSKGVIHRDLKPANVMLGDFGEVLVMDWGLAVAVTEDGKADKLDHEHAIGGTPAYMAPEMALGDAENIGIASDIYLLGAILFEIVTGERPHAGATAQECLLNAAENRIVETDATGELLDIALKAMATDFTDRYSSVRELQETVREVQAHHESVRLCSDARQQLQEASQSGKYDDYNQALFGFREALRMWESNSMATDGVLQTSLAFAERASQSGDLDLAVSLLNPEHPSHAALLTSVKAARRERSRRAKRIKSLSRTAAALATIIIVVLAAAFVWIRRERDRAEKSEAMQRLARQAREEALREMRKAQDKAIAALRTANELRKTGKEAEMERDKALDLLEKSQAQDRQKQAIGRWFKSLAESLADGTPILTSLEQLAAKGEDQKLKEATLSVITDVKSGRKLSLCLQDYPDLFDTTVIKLIQEGETEGHLTTKCWDVALYFSPELTTEERPEAESVPLSQTPNAPPRRMVRMILAEAARSGAQEIRLEVVGDSLRLTFDGEEKRPPPFKLYSALVESLLVEANVNEWPESQSGPQKRLAVDLAWGDEKVSCLLQSADINKELVVTRKTGQTP